MMERFKMGMVDLERRGKRGYESQIIVCGLFGLFV